MYKFSHFELKDLDVKKREVAFYFNAFAKYDSDKDRIFPGSSKKTAKENMHRIKHLYNHSFTVGKAMQVEEDDFGTFMVSKIGRDTDSDNVLLKYEDGLITEHSFGFEPIAATTKTNEKGGLDIYEYKLWEASSLDKWGAQEMTPTISLKSLERANIMSVIERLDSLNKALKKSYTDDQIIKFEKEIIQISSFLKYMATTQPDDFDRTTEPENVDKKNLDLDVLIKLFDN